MTLTRIFCVSDTHGWSCFGGWGDNPSHLLSSGSIGAVLIYSRAILILPTDRSLQMWYALRFLCDISNSSNIRFASNKHFYYVLLFSCKEIEWLTLQKSVNNRSRIDRILLFFVCYDLSKIILLDLCVDIQRGWSWSRSIWLNNKKRWKFLLVIFNEYVWAMFVVHTHNKIVYLLFCLRCSSS